MKAGFKTDKFRSARGGFSRWLSLSCGECGSPIMTYQKDGPGILKRLYIDRIYPQDKSVQLTDELICGKCKTVLGVKTVYEKEDRPAYRLFVGAVEKKIVSNQSVDIDLGE